MGLFDGIFSGQGSAFGFLNPNFNPSTSTKIGGVANKIGGIFNNAANGAGNGWSWFGNNGIIPVGLAGLQTLGGFGDFLLGMKNYNLAKDAFDFQKSLANRNLQNQAKLINNQYDTAANVGAALANQNYNGTINDHALAAQQAQAKKQYVDSSAIG